MYQIAITPRNENNNRKEIRFSFETKRIANKWFKRQQAKRALSKNFGAGFSNNTIEVYKLY
jgi:hypothetical protein